MIMGALAIKFARAGAERCSECFLKGERRDRFMSLERSRRSLERWRYRKPLSLRSPELERERFREGNEGERLPRHFPPRSLSVEGEQGGPAWEEPEGSKCFSRLQAREDGWNSGRGWGSKRGGSFSWPPLPTGGGRRDRRSSNNIITYITGCHGNAPGGGGVKTTNTNTDARLSSHHHLIPGGRRGCGGGQTAAQQKSQPPKGRG